MSAKPPSHRTESTRFPGTEFFDAETDRKNLSFVVAETAPETARKSKKAALRGTNTLVPA